MRGRAGLRAGPSRRPTRAAPGRLPERDRVLGGEQPDAAVRSSQISFRSRASPRTRRSPSASTRRTCGTRPRSRAARPRRARRPGSTACACASRHELGQVEDLVALAEAVPEHRDRAQLERARPEQDEVRVDPVQLAEQRAHPGRLRRHLDLEELLDREHEDELVVLERDVVDPLRVRDRLPPRLLLHVLLEARVQVADTARSPTTRSPERSTTSAARRASTDGSGRS